MRRLLTAAGIAALSALPALAADPVVMTPAPIADPVEMTARDWSGFFAGLHVGYGWGDSDMTNSSPPGPPSRTIGFDPSGILGGAQAGYDWQAGNVVIGAVADFTIGDLSDSFTNVPPPGPPFTATTEIEWMATLRARAGVVFAENTLLYGHGGLALASVRGTWIGNGGGGPGTPWNGRGRDTSVGWVVGAGVEHRFTDNLSLFAEYAYADFGSYRFDDPPPGPAVTFTQDTSISTVKIGVNYRF